MYIRKLLESYVSISRLNSLYHLGFLCLEQFHHDIWYKNAILNLYVCLD